MTEKQDPLEDHLTRDFPDHPETTLDHLEDVPEETTLAMLQGRVIWPFLDRVFHKCW